MSAPEGKVKAKVKALLKRFGIYSHWPVLNGMGEPTLDCIVCAWGRFVAIETKAPGKQPTPRQQVTMAAMRAAGAFVFVVADDDDLNVLEAYLNLLQP